MYRWDIYRTIFKQIISHVHRDTPFIAYSLLRFDILPETNNMLNRIGLSTLGGMVPLTLYVLLICQEIC